MLAQQLVNGILLGSTYALIALGLTLVLGVFGKLNIAHGDVFMFGAFAGVAAASFGASLALAILAGIFVSAVVNVIIERSCFYPLRNAHFLAPMLSTIAFGILLQNVATQIWGSDPSRYPNIEAVTQFEIGGILLSSVHIVILAVSFSVMLTVDIVIYRTKIGRALRATALDPEVAGLLGVNTKNVMFITFLTAGALAGVAGVLTAVVYSQISPLIGIRQGLIGMVAMVIGGLGNLRGAMIGGILIGLVEVLNDAYLDASYRDLIVFSLFFGFIILKPNGLFPQPSGNRS
ncbi:MAG: branched-chain amino acid ABC transporter permease [Rhodospirillales bacterium]|jgi:branched-chain amino acid transport system permease protein|nr:branched-chain amino acid ABC transporter permease [Rhodospirillales bacterium]